MLKFFDPIKQLGKAVFYAITAWLSHLFSKLSKTGEQRRLELDMIASELGVFLETLVPLYIEPTISRQNPLSPIDRDDSLDDNAFCFLNNFINSKNIKNNGQRQLFLLADGGMGKTSLLSMFKLGHENSFWPQKTFCQMLKIDSDTLSRIKNISASGRTVLLLDSLDEDIDFVKKPRERIVSILRATQNFNRVIITSRSSTLFSEMESVCPDRSELNVEGFCCPVRYLLPFNDHQVVQYLKKEKKRDKFFKLDLEIFQKMGNLKYHPMLLASIRDITNEDVISDGFQICSYIEKIKKDREKRKDIDCNLRSMEDRDNYGQLWENILKEIRTIASKKGDVIMGDKNKTVIKGDGAAFYKSKIANSQFVFSVKAENEGNLDEALEQLINLIPIVASADKDAGEGLKEDVDTIKEEISKPDKEQKPLRFNRALNDLKTIATSVKTTVPELSGAVNSLIGLFE